MSNWFYIRQWAAKKLSYIGKELSYSDASYLFRAAVNYSRDSKQFYALITKDDRWKVVSSKDDILDWKVISFNCIEE